MVNRVSSYFPKGGHSATKNQTNNATNTRKVEYHQNLDEMFPSVFSDTSLMKCHELPKYNGIQVSQLI